LPRLLSSSEFIDFPKAGQHSPHGPLRARSQAPVGGNNSGHSPLAPDELPTSADASSRSQGPFQWQLRQCSRGSQGRLNSEPATTSNRVGSTEWRISLPHAHPVPRNPALFLPRITPKPSSQALSRRHHYGQAQQLVLRTLSSAIGSSKPVQTLSRKPARASSAIGFKT
jgi:hypothetical protein